MINFKKRQAADVSRECMIIIYNYHLIFCCKYPDILRNHFSLVNIQIASVRWLLAQAQCSVNTIVSPSYYKILIYFNSFS